MTTKLTNFKLLLIGIILSLLFTNCNKDNLDNIVAPMFKIEAEYLELDLVQNGGYTRIPVETNLDLDNDLIFSSTAEEWVTASNDYKDENTILISFNTSEEIAVRTADISIKSPAGNYTIAIRQIGLGPVILINNSTIRDLSADGETVSITVTANVEYTVSTSEDSNWLTEVITTARALTDNTSLWNVSANPLYEERIGLLLYTATDSTTNATCEFIQNERNGDLVDVEIPEDTQHTPSSGFASDFQPGSGIENSFDGVFAGGAYHSTWSQSANFPVTLEYFFDAKPDLDYFIYYTRSGNGNFGELDIFYATEDSPDYTLLGDDYNFRMQSIPSKVILPSLTKVTKIKFIVKSGLNNFVSCDEMEFFEKLDDTDNPLESQLLSVFTDITCTELKEGVTQEMIYNLPSYFAQLAVAIKNDNLYDDYEKSFRIREYQAYSNVEEWSNKLMTKRYSNLDNCTGIYVEAGEEIIVLIGDTNGRDITLQSIKGLGVSGNVYFLNEGVNKIKIINGGMLFLMYTTTLPAPPIKVHIPINCGTVNGFFDLKEHKTNEKYAELIRKSSYKFFFIRGEKLIFYFHREKLLEVVPTEILPSIELWDNMVSWQQELMGIDEYLPSQFNNHILAISPEDGYMWAGDYQIGFVYTYLANILIYENVMATADNAWGPSHEMGHVHQYAINWQGSTESSNNLFSNYSIYKLGKYSSRGSNLKALANSQFVRDEPWAVMGYRTREDTELHMRMNWQLWNYFHRCGHKPDFWQELFKELRKPENRIGGANPGADQLKFAEAVCKVANQNLTDFFEIWGFFKPIDEEINQYGTWQYTVTQEMIDATQLKMKTYPPMEHAFYYLEDRKAGDVGLGNYNIGDVGYYTQFEGAGEMITKTITYTLNGTLITVINGDEAVAFEIKKDDELIYFFNSQTFDVPSEISLVNIKLYAVQADGDREEITKIN